MKFKLSTLGLSLLAIATVSSVHAMEIAGTVTAQTTITAPTNSNDARARAMVGQPQLVTLLGVKLNEDELKTLNGIRKAAAKRSTPRDSGLPVNAEVSMRGVPVLDQGRHGTCVTFAVSAALDSLLGKGDYVSQLCSLELGSHLKKESYAFSGWNGSFGPLVLDQFLLHGVVSKRDQEKGGCAGVKDYPLTDAYDTGNPMTADEYHGLSDRINKYIYWQPILDLYDFAFNDMDHEYDVDKVISTIKKDLALKRTGRTMRITFSTLLPYRMCRVGACGTYHQPNDTWALTKSMDREFYNGEIGGHQMMIIGYDDNAVVTDDEGDTHTGLFILRNSWGAAAGDNGNYYMTYDFFKRFASSAQRVVKSRWAIMPDDDDANNQERHNPRA